MLDVNNLGGTKAANSFDLARLCSELACGLRPAADIWHDHGITDRDEAARILALDVVQEMLREARAVWHSSGNGRARVKAQSLMAVEHLILPLVASAKNPALPLNHRTDVAKFLAKLGGLDVDPSGNGAGGGGVAVTISIDLTGGDGGSVVEGRVVRTVQRRVDGQMGDAAESEGSGDDWAEDEAGQLGIPHIDMIDEGEALDYLDLNASEQAVSNTAHDLLADAFSELPEWTGEPL